MRFLKSLNPPQSWHESYKYTLARPKLGREFFVATSLILPLGNAVFIVQAIAKGGWAALGYLLVISPAFNGFMLVVGVAKMIWPERNGLGWNYPKTGCLLCSYQ